MAACRAVALIAVLLPSIARGQFAAGPGVLDACGGWSSNGVFRALSSAFQANPVGLVAGPSVLCSAGFLQAFVARPDLDRDRDGLCDEDDPDNDNDGLADRTELLGGGFDPPAVTDPMSADSDGDGQSDGEESASGTNPGNPGSAFRITHLTREGAGLVIVWQSREGVAYEVIARTNAVPSVGRSVVLDTVTAAGGTGLWRETVSTSRVDAAGTRQFYRVRKVP